MNTAEQTEFWSDIDCQSIGSTSTYPSGNDQVYLDESSDLVDLFQEGGNDQATGGGASGRLSSERVDLPAASYAEDEPEEKSNLDFELTLLRPRVSSVRPKYAEKRAPRFNMARFLTVTGSLDSVADEGRWLQLPRGRFEAHVVLDVVRRISKDFLRDLRAPPRNHSIERSIRPTGWFKLS